MDGSGVSQMVTDMMKIIWNLFMKVKAEPVKYIGEPDLERLMAFWNGIGMYIKWSKGDVYDCFPEFRDFLVEKYSDFNVGGGHGFAQIVWLNSRNQKEAFYRFYELMEEFLALQGETYHPLRSRNFKEKISIIEGWPSKVIWRMMNDHHTLQIAFGRYSLNLLEAYVNGAIQCALSLENKEIKLLPGFDEYLCKRFNVQEKRYCFQVVREHAMNDEESYHIFYEWISAFLEEKGAGYEPVVECDVEIV